MKLFLYDTKHQKVDAALDLGDLKESDIALVNKVLAFALDNELTDGLYRSLTLADDIDVMYDEGEPQLVIRGVQ